MPELSLAKGRLDPAAAPGPVELSLVVPARDEEQNLELLYRRVCAVLDAAPRWELVIVDDGSSDATSEVIARLANRDARVVGARLPRRCGQTSAILAGADLARGEHIALLDGDLQNDPADLLLLLSVLGDYAAVVGYRLRWHDGRLRRLWGRAGDALRDAVAGEQARNAGCCFGVFRAEALRALPRFEGMHRYLPILLRHQGFRVLELPVAYHRRILGRSKYPLRRRLPAVVDLLALRWMRARQVSTEAPQRIGRCAECDAWEARATH